MGYTYDFAHNVKYGAQELNKITKRLVTSGVADIFEDGVSYNVTDLNNISSQVATMGVVPDSVGELKVVANGDACVKIQKGTAFFESGAVIEVDEDGINLNYTDGVINYVYVEHSESTNEISAKCDTAYPTGDFVMLAQISETGEITDKRVYARGKLPGYQSTMTMPIYIKQQLNFEDMTEQENGLYSKEITIPLGSDIGNYTTLIVKSESRRSLGVYYVDFNAYQSFAGYDGRIYYNYTEDCIFMYPGFDTSGNQYIKFYVEQDDSNNFYLRVEIVYAYSSCFIQDVEIFVS